jgi:hypothetical protein
MINFFSPKLNSEILNLIIWSLPMLSSAPNLNLFVSMVKSSNGNVILPTVLLQCKDIQSEASISKGVTGSFLNLMIGGSALGLA